MFRLQPARAVQRAFMRPAALASRSRFLSKTPIRAATKGAEDKDSLKPTSTEYSKSGSDDAAAHSDAAFNPNKTTPEEAEATAEMEAGGKDNSLNASPGNKEISKPKSSEAGGPVSAPDRKGSGAGNAPKNG